MDHFLERRHSEIGIVCSAYILQNLINCVLDLQVHVRAYPYPKAGRLAGHAGRAHRLHAHGIFFLDFQHFCHRQ